LNTLENIKIALGNVRSNLLRTVITLLIIALGITALVGILTAIDTMIYSMNDNFSNMEANSFRIMPKRDGVRGKRRGRQPKAGEVITFKQAMDFKDKFEFPSRVAVYCYGTGAATVKYSQEKTNPKSKGSSMGMSSDRVVLIPLVKAKTLYGHQNKNYNIAVALSSVERMDDAVSTAIGVLRNVRKLKVSEDNDFEIRKSDGLIEVLKENTAMIRMATVGIALITLLGAAIGLMNIMLVSVTERTREIG